nr:MAG: thioredoxin [Candidatus Nanosalinarum sp. J07AB56]
MNKKLVGAGVAVLVVAAVGFASVSMDSGGVGEASELEPAGNWSSVEMTDVNSGETYTVSDLDKPVVVEPFAAWCSTCLRQQKEMAEVQDSADVSFVSLNVDRNEGSEKVRRHAERNDFDWRYSVVSASVLRSLQSQFGPSVVIPPRAPKVVLCDEGTTRLSNGVKSGEKVLEEVENAC